jgi:predicted RNA-binding protein (virulence factor B family)
MSKKTFKKAIGHLYKEKLIEIKDDGIYLIS